jgi:hypothetical protein
MAHFLNLAAFESLIAKKYSLRLNGFINHCPANRRPRVRYRPPSWAD